MATPYNNLPNFGNAEEPSGGGWGKLILFAVGLGLGFVLGNLIVYNFHTGLFVDQTKESKILADSLQEEVTKLKTDLEEHQRKLAKAELTIVESKLAFEAIVQEKKAASFQLTITEPAPDTEIDGAVVTVKGFSSKPGITLTVDKHLTVAVNADGTFAFDYPLKAGENQISLQAFANEAPEEQQALSWKILKKAHWQEIARFTGKEGKNNTAKFKLSGTEAKFTIRPVKAGNYLSATLYETPDHYEELLYNKANDDLKGTDEVKFYKPGEYYISVYSTKTEWEIVVESME